MVFHINRSFFSARIGVFPNIFRSTARTRKAIRFRYDTWSYTRLKRGRLDWRLKVFICVEHYNYKRYVKIFLNYILRCPYYLHVKKRAKTTNIHYPSPSALKVESVWVPDAGEF